MKYWGIGNEVDGHWQIGYKTPDEYARAFTEFGKVMKWVDPDIKLIASGDFGLERPGGGAPAAACWSRGAIWSIMWIFTGMSTIGQ